MKKGFIAGGVIVALLLVIFVAGPVEAFSFKSFVEHLVEKGIIAPEKADKALKMAGIAEGLESENVGLNEDKIDLRVSQLIQFASREYPVGSNVEGLLLIVENTIDENVVLEARRRCAVTYRILDGDGKELYDNADKEICNSGEEVTYTLTGKQQRMFNVKHNHDDLALEAGTYTFVLEYPPYGSGELEVTITDEAES